MIKAINIKTIATIATISATGEIPPPAFLGALLCLVVIPFTDQNKILQARKLLIEVYQDRS